MERLRALAAHVASPVAGVKAAYVDDRSRESNDRAKRYTAGAVLSDQEAHEQLRGEFVRRGADGPIAEETFFEFPASGLFVDDYSKLPQPTTDVEKAKSDIDLYGYCESSAAAPALTCTYCSEIVAVPQACSTRRWRPRRSRPSPRR